MSEEMVIKDVEETIATLNRGRSLLHPEFTINSSMYVFTTENLIGSLSKLPVKGKEVLTVTASGDQLINLALMGAKRVDNFDTNRNAYYISALKVAALKTLSYEEFINFFTDSDDRKLISNGFLGQSQKLVNPNPNYFAYETYLKVRSSLPNDAMTYWDKLYAYFKEKNTSMTDTYLLYGGDKKAAITNNAYLRDYQSYQAAQAIFRRGFEHNYMHMDILQIHKIPHTYDLVLLSNIYEYLTDEYYNVISSDEFGRYITEELKAILNKGATVEVAYQYNYRQKNFVAKQGLKKLFSKKYILQERPELDKFKFKKMLVPSMVKEYREAGDADCMYLFHN